MAHAVPVGDFAADNLSSVSWSMQMMIRRLIRREDRQRLGRWNIGSPIGTVWMTPWFVCCTSGSID